MRQITAERFSDLLATQSPPCISLFQPTHRQHPANKEDPIRFKNLVRDLKQMLNGKYDDEQVQAALVPFEKLVVNHNFWNHCMDGLAIFGSPERFELFELLRPVQERLVVADSFHTKPLIRILQSADRFQVLCLSRGEAKLYEGNRDELEPVDAADLMLSIEKVWADQRSASTQAVGSYGKQSGEGGTAVHHGHGPKTDASDAEMHRYFRVVDQAVLEHHSRPSGLPLMLVALGNSQTEFRRISENPFLLDDGITRDPQSLDDGELRLAAWKVIEPSYSARLADLVDRFGTAKARQTGSGDLSDVAKAVVADRVATLLVDSERSIPGTLDRKTGAIEMAESADSHVDDLLDDIAELVIAKNGKVIVVPSDRMPTESGLAAIYRF